MLSDTVPANVAFVLLAIVNAVVPAPVPESIFIRKGLLFCVTILDSEEVPSIRRRLFASVNIFICPVPPPPSSTPIAPSTCNRPRFVEA